MGFVPAKALVLIQLSVLLLSCFTVFSDEVDVVSWAQSPHHHAPTYSPVEAPNYHGAHPPSHHYHHKGNPPSHSPSHPPRHPTVHPPMYPPRKPPSHPPMYPPSHAPGHPPSYDHPPKRCFVAVQGVVYCKSCKYIGVDTLLGASPLSGAVVRLQCNNTKYPLVEEAQTDKNGYFFIMAPKKITTYGSHKCKVFIVSSPLARCTKPTNLHDGLKGAILIAPPKSTVPPLPFEIFSVGPFAFEPSRKLRCPH